DDDHEPDRHGRAALPGAGRLQPSARRRLRVRDPSRRLRGWGRAGLRRGAGDSRGPSPHRRLAPSGGGAVGLDRTSGRAAEPDYRRRRRAGAHPLDRRGELPPHPAGSARHHHAGGHRLLHGRGLHALPGQHPGVRHEPRPRPRNHRDALRGGRSLRAGAAGDRGKPRQPREPRGGRDPARRLSHARPELHGPVADRGRGRRAPRPQQPADPPDPRRRDLRHLRRAPVRGPGLRHHAPGRRQGDRGARRPLLPVPGRRRERVHPPLPPRRDLGPRGRLDHGGRGGCARQPQGHPCAARLRGVRGADGWLGPLARAGGLHAGPHLGRRALLGGGVQDSARRPRLRHRKPGHHGADRVLHPLRESERGAPGESAL
ncbi:MAG: Capsular polysaccharide biosynthesis/export periplasmic protein WcbA; Capsular polysaccharide export system protein KpsC, partial [uncultured Rubellimicrobium sp.]